MTTNTTPGNCKALFTCKGKAQESQGLSATWIEGINGQGEVGVEDDLVSNPSNRLKLYQGSIDMCSQEEIGQVMNSRGS